MKIVTILGTRPEIIRLSLIIKKLDQVSDHIVIHTGQNFDKNLSDIFFKELDIRKPDYFLKASGSFGKQIGEILSRSEELLIKLKPDKFLVLGDTNSGLASIIAKRLGIKVFHMEAGNRCYSDLVPEEINRRIIDHSSDILLPYTQNSKNNLTKEGISQSRIIVTGNPIKEVLDHYQKKISSSQVLKKLKLKSKEYFLVTLHRAENVDDLLRLRNFINAFNLLVKNYQIPLIWSLHPRTRQKIDNNKAEFKLEKDILCIDPVGLFDFVTLEKNARCVLSDSGTVQEECCIFKIPNVTLRDVTERPETLEVGSAVLSGSKPEQILKCVKKVLSKPANWQPPAEYLKTDVSETVVKLLTS